MAGAKLERTRYPGIYRRGSTYVVTYRHRGKQHKRTAANLKAAQQLLATIKADIVRGEHRQGHTVTFAEYACEWIDTYQGRTTRGFREGTRTEYRRTIEKAIPWFDERCPKLVEIEPRDIRQFVAYLHSGKRGRSLSTIRNHLNVLRAMFGTAVEDGILRHNPCTGVRIGRTSTGPQVEAAVQRRALGETELQAWLAASPDDWRLFFDFMVHTGLRIGEALELRWGDVAFGERPMVKVRRQTRRGVVNDPKTEAGKRDIPLSPGLSRRLWTMQGRPGDPVFANPATGEQIAYHWAEHNILRKTRKTSGMSWVTFHSLRHTTASLLFAHGKNLKQVQHWLGHASPQLTQNTYLHLMDDGLGDADFLDELTGPTPHRLAADNEQPWTTTRMTGAA